MEKKIIVTDKEIAIIEEKAEKNELEMESLKAQIIREGGTQADDLKKKIKELESLMNDKKVRKTRYQELSRHLGLEVPTNEESFHDNFQKLQSIISHSQKDQKN